MPDLILHVKKEYFDEIKSGYKRYEYRLRTEYWKKRLVRREYSGIQIFCGYPKKGDASRVIRRKWTGCEPGLIRHKHFGNLFAAPVEIFAIDVSSK